MFYATKGLVEEQIDSYYGSEDEGSIEYAEALEQELENLELLENDTYILNYLRQNGIVTNEQIDKAIDEIGINL